MELNNRKEQHFAVSSNGELHHINEAHNSIDDYYCLNCGCHMLKKCGNIRQWHFAHDWRNATLEQRNCSYESYLHRYAKLRIKQWFEDSESIKIHLKKYYNCSYFDSCKLKNKYHCRTSDIESIDLKRYLDICEIEKEIQINGHSFRPDLLWCQSDNPRNNIFVEVKVTHKCTDQKINSSARIIEFSINSEEDIENIITHDIAENDITTFYGFKKRDVAKHKSISPLHKLIKFRLYKSGKVHLDTYCTCQNYRDRNNSSLFEITFSDYNFSETDFYIYGLLAAKDKNFNVRNCCICKHRQHRKNYDDYICLNNNSKIENNNNATSCEYFALIENYLEHRNRFIHLEQFAIDTWTNTNLK
ncbi:MAG: hypothetical protein HDR82_05225 [Bacteroides sp.]|nr:hypothetical protein [Bacteroides sp.]